MRGFVGRTPPKVRHTVAHLCSLIRGFSVMTRFDKSVLVLRDSRHATNALLSPGAGGSEVVLAWARPSFDGTFDVAILQRNLSVHQAMRPLAPSVAATPLHLMQLFHWLPNCCNRRDSGFSVPEARRRCGAGRVAIDAKLTPQP